MSASPTDGRRVRLWELCSLQWHTRTGDWWQPLPLEARALGGKGSIQISGVGTEPAAPRSENLVQARQQNWQSQQAWNVLGSPALIEREGK